jgi:hypothetical protein
MGATLHQGDAPSVRKRVGAATAHGEADATDGAHLEFVQIAFAGHNRADELGDPEAAARGVEAAFRMLAEAGIREGRLLTGLAPGADMLAARAWRAADLGPVHAIFPTLRTSRLSGSASSEDGATWLDNQASRAIGRNPHLTLTRWLIAAADLLVVVWSGSPARGPGGTADAVRLAREQRIPILWHHPGAAGGLKLIVPAPRDQHLDFLEFLSLLKSDPGRLVQPATPDRVRAALEFAGVEPAEAALAESATAVAETNLSGPRLPWPWRTYASFRRLLGGPSESLPRPRPPEDLAAQPGFVLLTERRSAAARVAQRLGAVHRSQQVILLTIAILAAAAGSASVLLPGLKVALVSFEVGLAVIALVVSSNAERGGRHLRWGEARRLAETLRLERAAWALGLTGVARPPEGSSSVRRLRRIAGIPSGAFDRARLKAWGDWIRDDLILGQVAYHRDQSRISGRMSHRVHQAENFSFTVLLVVLLGYLASTAAGLVLPFHKPEWLGGVVVMAGAIVPAIGAAGLALEATLSLGEQAHRSHGLAEELQALASESGGTWALEDLQRIAGLAIRLERAQEDHWTDEVARRRLFRGG